MASISENVEIVKANIAKAAVAAGRRPEDVLLIAATKMNGCERVREAIAAGVDICGENRVQELLEKNAQHAYDGVPVHFIGHLQKNKVKNVVGTVELIHSVDSIALLEAINRCAEARGIVQDVLLEVNIGREESKSGFFEEEISSALLKAAPLSSVRVRGLMAIPPISAFPQKNSVFFTTMKHLFIDNGEKKYDNISMDFLSMGMSGDYTEAVACGANMVRIGSAIFGPRIYPDKTTPHSLEAQP